DNLLHRRTAHTTFFETRPRQSTTVHRRRKSWSASSCAVQDGNPTTSFTRLCTYRGIYGSRTRRSHRRARLTHLCHATIVHGVLQALLSQGWLTRTSFAIATSALRYDEQMVRCTSWGSVAFQSHRSGYTRSRCHPLARLSRTAY